MSEVMVDKIQNESVVNPYISFLREDRRPHIWCPGCGIGTSLNCFVRGLTQAKADLQRTVVVSGIGCAGRVAGYLNLDSFHTTHGRAIPFATGLKVGNPDLNVVVYSGDGDLFAIGGNHFIHAVRRNVDLLVICVNNYHYAMTGGQVASTTPLGAMATTVPYGNYEPPFNTCYLADCCGAAFVARWTVYHVAQLASTVKEAVLKRGFRYIEVISPCPTLYSRRNKLGSGLDTMCYYKDNTLIRNGADTRSIDLEFQGKIVVGKFVDRSDRLVMSDAMEEQLSVALGNLYTRPEHEE